MSTSKTIIIAITAVAGSLFVVRQTIKNGDYTISSNIHKDTYMYPVTYQKTSVRNNPTQDIQQNDQQQQLLKKELGIITFRKQKVTPGLVFRIQLLASRYPISSDSRFFKGCDNVREYNYEGLYKYTTGEFNTPRQSESLFFALEKKGFHDTFLVAFKDDKPIRMIDAMKKIKKQ